MLFIIERKSSPRPLIDGPNISIGNLCKLRSMKDWSTLEVELGVQIQLRIGSFKKPWGFLPNVLPIKCSCVGSTQPYSLLYLNLPMYYVGLKCSSSCSSFYYSVLHFVWNHRSIREDHPINMIQQYKIGLSYCNGNIVRVTAMPE